MFWRRVAVGLLLGIATCGIVAVGVVALPDAAGPRGHLVVIGGGTRPASVMGLFARLAGGGQAHVLVFPQASERPEAGTEIERELKALGLGRVTVIGVNRAGADGDDALRVAAAATGVYFGGGDQGRLMAVLHGSRLEQKLRQMYLDGAVIAGTSAGAAVMSRVMITGDESRPLSKDESWQTIEGGNVVTGEGLGLLEGVIVDQHFVRRRRHNRLISLVLEQPRLLGVGVDEATAVWVKPDGTFEVVGDGPVLVVDARDAEVARDEPGQGLRGAGLRLHVLRAGARYDPGKRVVLGLR